MKCHFVPQVYQKSWKKAGSNASIFLFEKEFGYRAPKLVNIGDNFEISSYYIIKLFKHGKEQSYCISLFEDELKSYYYSNLNKYTIFLNEQQIFNFSGFIENIHHFDEFKIMLDDQHQKTKRIKNDLEVYWNVNISKTIENFFSNTVENNWRNLKDNLDNLLSSSEVGFNPYFNDLIEYISIQISRNIQSESFRIALSEALDIVSDLMEPVFSNVPELKDQLYTEDFAKETWLNQLLIYVRGNKKNNIIQAYINNFSNMAILFIKNNGTTFITSDYPVQIIESNVKGKGIVLFSINKNYCAIIVNSPTLPRHYYQVLHATDDIVKYINYRISQGATKIINDVKYFEKTSLKPVKDFENMFKKHNSYNIF